MENIEDVSHLLILTGLYWALLLALMNYFGILSFGSSKRQRILPNVPIVGLDGSKSIRQARENFRNGSKAMLLEGYREVFFSIPRLDLGSSIVVQRKTILCADENGRATHDPGKVCGGA